MGGFESFKRRAALQHLDLVIVCPLIKQGVKQSLCLECGPGFGIGVLGPDCGVLDLDFGSPLLDLIMFRCFSFDFFKLFFLLSEYAVARGNNKFPNPPII